MTAAARDAFERTIPRREWAAKWGRLTLIWAAVSALLLGLLLLQAGLMTALLIDRGEFDLRIPVSEIPRFELVTGQTLPNKPEPDAAVMPDAVPVLAGAPVEAKPAAAPDLQGAPPVIEPEYAHRFENSGLLPTVWRVQRTWWGGALAAAYRNCSWLRWNIGALVTLLVVLAITGILRIAAIGQLRTASRNAALEVTARLRRQLHRQALRLGTEDLDGSGAQGVADLFGADSDRLRASLYEWLYRVTRAPWELAILVLCAGSVEVLLTAQWVLLSVVGWMLIHRSRTKADQTRRIAEDRAHRELQSLTASLHASRMIRGYGMDAQELEQFQSRLQRYIDEVRIQNRVIDDPLWLRIVLYLGLAVLGAFLWFILGAKVLTGEITPAGAAVFVSAYGLALETLRKVAGLKALRSDANVVADRIWRYLDRLPGVSQAVGAKFINPLSQRLYFENITYRGADQRLLLDRVDVQLPAGKIYSLISLDPVEPKAFAFLLPRFIEPQTGRILFDGEDIAWGTLESLRAETVVVSAADALFPGSILDNLRAGRGDVSLAQATEAAKQVHAHHFISRLPLGYETVVASDDGTFDASQRFRLALARGLLRNPAILIIEEPDEIDEESKPLIDDTYARICPGRTIFFLPRRLSTVRRSDEILLFRNGRIEAIGTHAALVKDSRLYQHWEYVRFHEFRHE